MFQPLAGMRVVDLTQVLAGPYCTYILGMLGAEVIKVEPPEGEWSRLGGGDAALAAAGMGAAFLTQNAGKRSVALDLKTDAGRAALRELIAAADIFVENFRPGTAERLGLSYDAVRAIVPTIVYCSLSAFGQDGEWSPRPAYDHVVQGISGITYLTGAPETVPNKVGAPYVDYATGMHGAMAVLAAVLERQRTGEAQRVDVAMLDTAMLLMASHMTAFSATGKAPGPAGMQAFSGSATSGAFETMDGTLLLAANNDRQVARLATALGLEDLFAEPRFATASERVRNAGPLSEALGTVFATATAAEWETKLNAAAVPACRLRHLEETLASPHLAERELLVDMPVAGTDRTVRVPTLGFKANGETVAPKTPPPRLGENA